MPSPPFNGAISPPGGTAGSLHVMWRVCESVVCVCVCVCVCAAKIILHASIVPTIYIFDDSLLSGHQIFFQALIDTET